MVDVSVDEMAVQRVVPSAALTAMMMVVSMDVLKAEMTVALMVLHLVDLRAFEKADMRVESTVC